MGDVGGRNSKAAVRRGGNGRVGVCCSGRRLDGGERGAAVRGWSFRRLLGEVRGFGWLLGGAGVVGSC